ncbi:MAG: archaellin/type IV pilin N-terminal domain-containing protein [Dehalococcoidia bacterium]
MRRRFKRLLEALHSEREGITGLETAIILIAFVVVASVFAYTVLSAGIFSSQKAQEAIHSGMESARAALEIKGSVVAIGNTSSSSVTSIIFTVANALSGVAIDFTPPTDNNSDGLADSGSSNVTVISYHSLNVATADLVFSTVPKGRSDADYLLETGEKFELTIDMTGVGETIGPYTNITLEIKPPKGAIVIMERSMPGRIDDVMILY